MSSFCLGVIPIAAKNGSQCFRVETKVSTSHEQNNFFNASKLPELFDNNKCPLHLALKK